MSERNLSESGFYKLFERMKDCGGLYRDPVLLCAVLQDMKYPADELFGFRGNKADKKAELVLGSGAALAMKYIVSEAIKDTRKGYRDVRFWSRASSCTITITKVRSLMDRDCPEKAFNELFIYYSCITHSAFPHSRSRHIMALDQLCKLWVRKYESWDSNQKRTVGTLLAFCYVMFEFKMIFKKLIGLTQLSKRVAETLLPSHRGLEFFDGITLDRFKMETQRVLMAFENTVQQALDDGQVQEYLVSDELIYDACSVLEYFIAPTYTNLDQGFFSKDTIDYIFDNRVGLDSMPKIVMKVYMNKKMLDKISSIGDRIANIKDEVPAHTKEEEVFELYVNRYASKRGGEQDGRSWATAFDSVETALSYSNRSSKKGHKIVIRIGAGLYPMNTHILMIPFLTTTIEGGWCFNGKDWYQSRDSNFTILYSTNNMAPFTVDGSFTNVVIENLCLCPQLSHLPECLEMPSKTYKNESGIDMRNCKVYK